MCDDEKKIEEEDDEEETRRTFLEFALFGSWSGDEDSDEVDSTEEEDEILRTEARRIEELLAQLEDDSAEGNDDE